MSWFETHLPIPVDLDFANGAVHSGKGSVGSATRPGITLPVPITSPGFSVRPAFRSIAGLRQGQGIFSMVMLIRSLRFLFVPEYLSRSLIIIAGGRAIDSILVRRWRRICTEIFSHPIVGINFVRDLNGLVGSDSLVKITCQWDRHI